MSNELYVCPCTATMGDAPQQCPECGYLSRCDDDEDDKGRTMTAIRIEPLSSIKPKRVRWLWHNRVPRGKVTVFGGDVGVGKSLISVDVVARASTGRGYPGDEDSHDPVDVLMFFCEDGAEDTVVPRLMAAGADLSRIKRVTGEFALDEDLKSLEQTLRANPSIKLVVIDPASSYLGDVNLEKEREVRRVLMPLAQLAERLDVTIILILHFNKRSDVKAIHRLLGAIAFSGVARAVWLFAEDPDNEDQNLMLHGKMNVAKKQEALQYGIGEQSVTIEGDATDVPFVEWKGTSKVDAERVIGAHAAREGAEKLTEAGNWLWDFLATEKPSKEVYKEAAQRGISKRTLERAKSRLRIESEKTEVGWIWHRPEPEPMPSIADAPEEPLPNLDDAGGGGQLEGRTP